MGGFRSKAGYYFVVWCDEFFLQKKEDELIFIEKEGFDFLGEGKKNLDSSLPKFRDCEKCLVHEQVLRGTHQPG